MLKLHHQMEKIQKFLETVKVSFHFIYRHCDPNLKILDIVARWPGSTHDSTIFNNSALQARFENRNVNNGSLLVADSGYQNRNYIIRPLLQVHSAEENLFNESLI